MRHSETNHFAQAREKKRSVFQEHWNHFLRSPLFLISLILLTVAQIMFFVFSGEFIRRQAISLSFVTENHPWWCYGAIAGVQILCAAPGFAILAGLWHLRRFGLWQECSVPNISGLKLIRIVNLILCIVTGLMLALYPTIILTAGEYMMEDKLIRVFYILLPFILLFIVCVSLVRIIIRSAEENVTCCWAQGRCLIPMILILVAAAVVFSLLKKLFFWTVALLAAAFAFVLFVYWLFLRKTSIALAAIDRHTIAKRENADDPYNRY